MSSQAARKGRIRVVIGEWNRIAARIRRVGSDEVPAVKVVFETVAVVIIVVGTTEGMLYCLGKKD